MRWRFMAAIMTMSLLVLLVQDIPLSAYLTSVENDRIITALERDAFMLAGRAEEALESASPIDDEEVTDLAKAYRDAGGSRVVIVDAAGIAIVTSDEDVTAVGSSYLSRPEIGEALSGVVNSGSRFSTTLQFDLVFVAVPVLSGDRVLGAVRLTYPQQVITDAVNAKLSVLGIVSVTTVLLAGIVGFIFSGTITRRLRLLREATERIANGDLTARADEKSGAPELRSLSRSLNFMAERLDRLIHQQRSFAADASHQLRTPLTALQLRLEAARELLESDPKGAADRLLAAEAETERLAAIIEGLLVLSRSEAGATPLSVIDLAVTAKDRAEQWTPLAQELGVEFVLDVPEFALALAADSAAEQIIDNLVDNALSVSPRGGTLRLVVSSTAESVTLHVIDDGPGLSSEQREHAFDRFWRADTSKSGSGLGLAIVNQLATASRATARLDARAEGGLDASVTFTVAP